jgi:PAS domain S-box-containing protein
MDARAPFPEDVALRAEAERLRALVASLGLGVVVEDETGRVLLANEEFCRMFHIPLSPTELLGKDCAEAALQAAALVREPDTFLTRIQQVLARRAPVERDEVVFHDGRVLERDFVPIAVDSVGRGHLWVYRDVTRRRRDAEAERAAALRDELRVVVDTIPGLVFSARPDGHIDFVNRQWCEYTGLEADQIAGWGWEAAIFAEDLARFRAHWRGLVEAGRPGEWEARLRRFDGTYRWFLFRAVPLHDQRANLVKWYGQTTDIDDRKRAEAMLAGEKQLLEMLAAGASLPQVLDALCRLVEGVDSGCRCGIVLVDPTGTSLEHGAAPNLPESYNRSIHGRPVNLLAGPCGMAVCLNEQVISRDIATDTRWDAYEWGALARVHGLRSCWSTPIVSGEKKVVGAFAIYQYQPGSPTPLQQQLIGQFTHLASVVIERKRSEDALQQAQAELSHVTRVTTLGELAASIAHEVNQPLSAIVADASACLNWLAAEPVDLVQVRAALANIVEDGARAGDILKRIRGLLSRSAAPHARLDLIATIHGALEVARLQLSRQQMVLETSVTADGFEVLGDPVELQQVVLNLVLNAGEAAKGCGTERRRVLVRASTETRADKRWARVSVEDAGVGINEDQLPQLFAPFYTTKPNGLGMGLSITRSIIDRHGGRIWASSNPAHGATFHVELPTISAPAATEGE